MAFIANNNNPQGGGVPGQARNTMANYPAKSPTAPGVLGSGFAGTKPRIPPRNRFTPGNMGGASTGQDALGVGVTYPGTLPGRLFDSPTMRDRMRGGLDVSGKGFANNGSGAGAVTGGGYQGNGTGDRFGGDSLARQVRRQMRRMDGPQMTPDAAAPAGAMDEAMDATGNDPTGANREGMDWRAARRDALQSGALERTEDGFASTNPGDATGANRAGMDWRAQRRDAKRSGAMDVTGANRIGMDYRRDRRQARRGAMPDKPGQPPAM